MKSKISNDKFPNHYTEIRLNKVSPTQRNYKTV